MSKAIDKVYKLYGLKEKGYKKTRMDGEQIIYKDYGEFDIEVSGLDNYREKRIWGRIYIWKNKCKIAKTIPYVSFDELNNILHTIDNLHDLELVMEYKFREERK